MPTRISTRTTRPGMGAWIGSALAERDLAFDPESKASSSSSEISISWVPSSVTAVRPTRPTRRHFGPRRTSIPPSTWRTFPRYSAPSTRITMPSGPCSTSTRRGSPSTTRRDRMVTSREELPSPGRRPRRRFRPHQVDGRAGLQSPTRGDRRGDFRDLLLPRPAASDSPDEPEVVHHRGPEVSLDEIAVGQEDPVERERGVDAADLEGVDALEHPTHRRVTGGTADDELRDERIVERGDRGSRRHPGVDPNLGPGGGSKVDDRTGHGREIRGGSSALIRHSIPWPFPRS